MSAIGPKLPLTRDDVFGHFSLFTEYKDEQDYLDNSNILSITVIYDVPSINLSTSLVLAREDIN